MEGIRGGILFTDLSPRKAEMTVAEGIVDEYA
jgi:hypothetical protein